MKVTRSFEKSANTNPPDEASHPRRPEPPCFDLIKAPLELTYFVTLKYVLISVTAVTLLTLVLRNKYIYLEINEAFVFNNLS
jgi:hypothetical protein